ncbi:MAG: hypothetical protein M3004_05305 [Bacteroidota bacterium]|nr:hypothetical protein [Bacteroidota bacterium]
MNKFFTSFILLLLCFEIQAQQHKSAASVPFKKKIVKSPTAKRTTNLPAPYAYRNIEKSLDFNGQWKGSFTDNSTSFIGFGGEKIDYVLELECHGVEVTGYSYTYFTDRGKRYYTICKVKGTLNRATKEIIATEFERTKFNTPPDFSNCFQTHKLKYVKQNDDIEVLQGSWFPAPDQNGDCGYGRTSLERKIIKRIILPESKLYRSAAKKNQPFKDREPQKQATKTSNPINKDQLKKTTLIKNSDQTKKPLAQKDTSQKEIAVTKPPIKKEDKINVPDVKFENRTNAVLKTIAIKNETFTVDFYDNGEIDGDTISVFFNGKLVLSNKMLTDKPITIKLTIDPEKPVNELVMYAESLGTIPPNTALMIVHDGDNRYEARIESDLGRNGTIRFTHKSKSP